MWSEISMNFLEYKTWQYYAYNKDFYVCYFSLLNSELHDGSVDILKQSFTLTLLSCICFEGNTVMTLLKTNSLIVLIHNFMTRGNGALEKATRIYGKFMF